MPHLRLLQGLTITNLRTQQDLDSLIGFALQNWQV